MLPELTHEDWPERFEAVRFPRGNLVVSMPQRRVEASLGSMEEAEAHAEAMNRWLAAKPSPEHVPLLPASFDDAPSDSRLDRILDGQLAPERHAEALKQAVTS